MDDGLECGDGRSSSLVLSVEEKKVRRGVVGEGM